VKDNLIIGGGLNFTLSSSEVWGDIGRTDPLANFLSSLLHKSGLVDLQPSVVARTWWNGCTGPAGISKRLDRFLLNSKLIDIHHKIRTWVEASFIYDQNPV